MVCIQEVEYDGMDWIKPAEDRDRWRALVNTVMNHNNVTNLIHFYFHYHKHFIVS
jgi:hypothetical protein